MEVTVGLLRMMGMMNDKGGGAGRGSRGGSGKQGKRGHGSRARTGGRTTFRKRQTSGSLVSRDKPPVEAISKESGWAWQERTWDDEGGGARSDGSARPLRFRDSRLAIIAEIGARFEKMGRARRGWAGELSQGQRFTWSIAPIPFPPIPTPLKDPQNTHKMVSLPHTCFFPSFHSPDSAVFLHSTLPAPPPFPLGCVSRSPLSPSSSPTALGPLQSIQFNSLQCLPPTSLALSATRNVSPNNTGSLHPDNLQPNSIQIPGSSLTINFPILLRRVCGSPLTLDPSSAGIQTLLEAEKEAAKIVAKARQYRIQRLKDARTEATKEIESLKSLKASDFAAFERTFSGDSDVSVSAVTRETDARLVEVQKLFERNKQQVLDKLLEEVVAVKPKVHTNALNPHSAY
ncbi:H(+)-transporting V1 sector ATPase subunit G [Gonapodya sp. JEL0774]|nr:H(+)-transporting V1 sector ATPase subunit G [Gonapodya sp. JEL0774]